MDARSSLLLASLTSLLALTGCSSGSPEGAGGGSPTSANRGFVSDNPGGDGSQTGGDANGAGPSATGSSGAGGADNPGVAPEQDPERVIAEADIIQIDGDRLYALSQYGGLNVVDVSTADHLVLLGRYQVAGSPFEMYLRDGLIYAMFTDWARYEEDAQGQWITVSTSRVEVLDVSDPANIQKKGSFDMPGWIQDSRIVGDVLYAVTFEDGYCYGCQLTPNTTVTSIAVGDPASIGVVDQLRFTDEDPYGYGWRRSISVTQDRMFVAGVEWDGSANGHSTIQVVDISDPGGALELGATVEAAGQIESRWQMDERDGVLRVVSQPGIWGSGSPEVQTFAVASSNDVQPLGSTTLILPQSNERLRSVRFDGPRAYAITAVEEVQDPLYTIDLSDPSAPKQMGELEMPGYVYHMEPRGDRVVALGFDTTNASGSMNVSLFDVADLTQPKLIERVNFGGDWSTIAEGQDQVHKAFKVLDADGLVLVPYDGWVYDSNDSGCGAYKSGIQLVDYGHDDLALRGVAPSRGQARRAFLQNGRLFAVSDESVRTFDIADRDAPAKKDDLSLATHVSQAVLVGDVVARVADDWWTNEARLEIAPASDPGRAEPLGVLDLEPLLGGVDSCYYGWGYGSSTVLALGHHLVLTWPSDDGSSTRLATVDLADPSSPKVAAELTLPFSTSSYDSYSSRVVGSGDSVVLAGSTLVFRHTESVGYDADPSVVHSAWLEIVDLGDPAKPVQKPSVALPSGAGHTLLRVDGGVVLTSHWVPLLGDPSRARFWLDRLDVSDSSHPHPLAPINVPGSLAAYDHDTERLLTVDYRRETRAVVSYEQCYTDLGYDAMFDPAGDDWMGPGTCTRLHRSFKVSQLVGAAAVLLDDEPIDDQMWMPDLMVGDDRVFTLQNGYYPETDSSGSKIHVVAFAGGTIESASFAVDMNDWVTPLAATGDRLVTSTSWPATVSVLDASDLDAMTLDSKGELIGYAYDVAIAGDKALCSMGPYGIQVIDLE